MCRIPSDKQRTYAALTHHPAWAELKEDAAAAREREMVAFANKLYTKGPTPEVVAAISSARDFFRGVQWVLNQCDFSAAAIARANQQDGDDV